MSSRPPAPPPPPTDQPAADEQAAVPDPHQEDALDEALEESFPSSDPIAVTITRE